MGTTHTDKRYAFVRVLTRHADTIAAHGYQEKVRKIHLRTALRRHRHHRRQA